MWEENVKRDKGPGTSTIGYFLGFLLGANIPLNTTFVTIAASKFKEAPLEILFSLPITLARH